MATPQQHGAGKTGRVIGVNPLRYARLSEPELHEIFLDIVTNTPFIRKSLRRAQELALPDWRMVSGALYNVVWNHLTGRPDTHGVKDMDLFYFDSDTSWKAEDAVIRNATGFTRTPPVEIRNQARVHLWYKQHFGQEIPPFSTVEQAIDVFASKTHCVGLRLDDDKPDLYAPYGLRDIFALRVVPNPIRDNRATHETKSKRALACWPELTVLPWPTEYQSITG